jgi:hypothetical protein
MGNWKCLRDNYAGGRYYSARKEYEFDTPPNRHFELIAVDPVPLQTVEEPSPAMRRPRRKKKKEAS